MLEFALTSSKANSAQQLSKPAELNSSFHQGNDGLHAPSIVSFTQTSQGTKSSKHTTQDRPFVFSSPAFETSSFPKISNQHELSSKGNNLPLSSFSVLLDPSLRKVITAYQLLFLEVQSQWVSPPGGPTTLKVQQEPPREQRPPTQTLQTSKEQAEDQETARKKELELQLLREREKKKLEVEELAKKEAARREFEELQAARKEKEKKEAAEREAAKRARDLKQQEEELKAAREEIRRRETMESKAAERDIARREAIEREVVKRKALYDEREEETSSRNTSKIARLGQRQTLSVEELLALEMSKQKVTPPRPRMEQKSLIDEDELLFNAARMAGTELSRVRLFEGLPFLRESISRPSTPSSTFSSSLMGRTDKYTRSASVDGSHATVNGYEVALAPETPLGLGRSLSRTEQRIRQTGARGLAYKPITNLLDTPEDKGKQKVSKRRKIAPSH